MTSNGQFTKEQGSWANRASFFARSRSLPGSGLGVPTKTSNAR